MYNDMHMDDTFLFVVHYTLCNQNPSYWEEAIESRIKLHVNKTTTF